jgi:ADP-heptose:LPS heptosyltransferase
MGDTVLALPCFHLIRQGFPEAKITVLTNAPISGKAAPLESVLGPTGLVDEVIPYPVGLRDPRQLFSLVRRLRAAKFDLLVSLTAARGRLASIRDLLFFKACGIRKIVGIPFRQPDLICMRVGELFEPETKRLLRRLGPLELKISQEETPPDLRLSHHERDEAMAILQKNGLTGGFIAASLGTKSQLNDWGKERWTDLLGRLSSLHPELGLILLGSADERERSNQVSTGWRGPRLNLCGITSPRVSAALLGRALLFLGHDSGPMHLAAAAGTRCVAIFSARCPPGQWFPVGDHHRPLYPLDHYDPAKSDDLPHQQRALASIGVEDVLAAVESVGVLREFQTK